MSAKPKPGQSKLYLLTRGTLLAYFLISILILLFSLNKGLDITDESFYLLSYQFPQENLFFPSAFHLLIHALFDWMNPGIVFYRLLRFILTIFCLYVFSASLFQWQHNHLEQPSSDFKLLFLIIWLSSLVNYALGSQTPGYNDFTLFITLLASALLVRALDSSSSQRLLFGIGALLGLEFYIKFSTSILLLLFFAGFWLIMRFSRNSLIDLLILIAGYFSAFIVLLIITPSMGEWLSSFSLINEVYSSAGAYNLSQMLSNYLFQFGNMLYYSLVIYWPIFLALIFVKYSQKHSWFPLIWLLSSLYFIFQQWVLLPEVGSFVYSLWFILFLLIFIEVLFYREIFKSCHKSLFLTALFLWLIPLICVVGTAGDFVLQSTKYIPLGLGGFFILYQSVVPRQAKLSILLVLITLSASIQGIYYSVYKPYRLAGNLFHQSSPSSFPNLKGIYLDAQTSQYLDNLNHLIQSRSQYQAPQPIVALYNMPGLVYALGGISPGIPWFIYYSDPPSNPTISCYALTQSKIKQPEKTLIIFNGYQVHPLMYQCLEKIGIPYKKYQAIGSLWMQSPHSYPGDHPFQEKVTILSRF